MNMALVMIGGFFGAISRFGISQFIKKRTSFTFPIATLLVNLIGALLLGVIIGNNMAASWSLLLGTGFMGAFTTFSTFKLELIESYTKRHWKTLISHLILNYIGGFGLALIGLIIGINL